MTENPIEETEELELTDKEADVLADRIVAIHNDGEGTERELETGLTVPLAFKDGMGVYKRIGTATLQEDGSARVVIEEGGPKQGPRLMEALFKMDVAMVMSTEVRKTEKKYHRKPTPSNHTKKNKKRRKK